jgi:hypothetical protein
MRVVVGLMGGACLVGWEAHRGAYQAVVASFLEEASRIPAAGVQVGNQAYQETVEGIVEAYLGIHLEGAHLLGRREYEAHLEASREAVTSPSGVNHHEVRAEPHTPVAGHHILRPHPPLHLWKEPQCYPLNCHP